MSTPTNVPARAVPVITPFTVDAPPRVRFEDWLAWLAGPTGDGVRRLIARYAVRFSRAPGSARAHHAWPGGWMDHTEEVCDLARGLYSLEAATRPPQFSLESAILVLFLHDIEKPFLHVLDLEDGFVAPANLREKAGRAQFRLALLEEFGIRLSDDEQNALQFVEGEGESYRPGERVMGRLAAFCHACDVLSARQYFDSPSPEERHAERDPAPAPSLAQAQERLAGFRSSVSQMSPDAFAAHVKAAAAAEDAMNGRPAKD